MCEYSSKRPTPHFCLKVVCKGGAYFWELTLPTIQQPLVMVLSKWVHSKAIFAKYHNTHAFRGDVC